MKMNLFIFPREWLIVLKIREKLNFILLKFSRVVTLVKMILFVSKIFMDVLEGKGTPAQNAAVIANAGMALYCADQQAGLLNSVAKAKEALESGKALESFKKLINR